MNLSNPGTKEYLVVGGVVLVLALGYFYLKNKSSGAAAPAAASAPAASTASSPTGLSTDTLKLWIKDHQSSPKKKTVTKKAA